MTSRFTPLYPHDCVECFLFATQDGVDYYACRKDVTVVARFSGEPLDYTSAPILGAPTDEAIDLAARQAFEGKASV